MNGFDLYDRYDFIVSWVMAIVAVSALIIGAPLWAIVLICVVGCTVIALHHFDELM